MRHIAFAFATAASLVATAAVAHADTFDVADPSEIAATPTAPSAPPPVAGPRAEPTMYLGLGGLAGATDNLLVGAWTADAGYRLDDSAIWIHGMVATGGAAVLLASGSGSFSQVRLGVERRGCIADGMVCSMIGADLGYQHTSYNGTDASFDSGDGEMEAVNDASVVVVPRFGLDVGGALRVRPTIEIPFGGPTGVGFDMTLAVAYEW